jgi:hypothetical protein
LFFGLGCFPVAVGWGGLVLFAHAIFDGWDEYGVVCLGVYRLLGPAIVDTIAEFYALQASI